MPLISVYIIAHNEADKISAAIESTQWADEIVVVDSWSTDGTADIATKLGARVVQVDFKGFGDLRNQAIAACTHEWIFSLDSDERCTAAASAEIQSIISNPDSLDVYWTPRRNYFMGRWIKHSGWYPNYRQPQLFRKDAMRYDLQPVHEGYILHTAKPIGHMKNAIWQFPFKNIAELMHKSNRYSSLGAEKIKHKNCLWEALWSMGFGRL
jgi:glycosyltransferase involved in cell wall biosynthesis